MAGAVGKGTQSLLEPAGRLDGHGIFAGHCFLPADALLDPLPVQGDQPFNAREHLPCPLTVYLSPPTRSDGMGPPARQHNRNQPPLVSQQQVPHNSALHYCQGSKEARTLLEFASCPFGQQPCFPGLAKIFITTSLCEVSTPSKLRKVYCDKLFSGSFIFGPRHTRMRKEVSLGVESRGVVRLTPNLPGRVHPLLLAQHIHSNF